MPVIHALKRPLQTKDLREAIFEALTVWRACQTTADTRVYLYVATSHRDAIRCVAEALPANTRGFEPLGSEENLTAREALTRCEVKPSAKLDMSWSGDVVPLLSPAAFEALLMQLRNLKPDPLRRTAVNLRVTGIRWKGAGADSAGSFQLSDDKVFSRKVRFSILTNHEAPDGQSASALRTEFESIHAATGIDFRAGKRIVVRAERAAQPNPAVPCLLFDHCVELLSDELRDSGFDWRELAGVFPDGKGVERRFHAALLPKPTPFRWETAFNQFMKTALPSFKKENGLIDDAHTYLAPLTDEWKFALVVDTHPGRRIGRVFKLRCGIVAADKTAPRFRRTAPVLCCAGAYYTQHHDWCPEFSFNDEAEFAAIVASLTPFLPNFMSRFEDLLRTIFLPGLENLTNVLPETRALSAREAYQAACDYARSLVPGRLQLARVELSNVVDGLRYREDHDMQMPVDGRAKLFHRWDVTVANGDQLFVIHVPFAGRISTRTRPGTLGEHHIGDAIEGAWLDSDVAAQSFFAKRDELAARYPEMDALVAPLKLRTIDGRLAWLAHIEFSARGERQGWALITHAIDARTGERIGTTFDERFEDRPNRRTMFTEGGPSLHGIL